MIDSYAALKELVESEDDLRASSLPPTFLNDKQLEELDQRMKRYEAALRVAKEVLVWEKDSPGEEETTIREWSHVVRDVEELRLAIESLISYGDDFTTGTVRIGELIKEAKKYPWAWTHLSRIIGFPNLSDENSSSAEDGEEYEPQLSRRDGLTDAEAAEKWFNIISEDSMSMKGEADWLMALVMLGKKLNAELENSIESVRDNITNAS